MASKNTLLGAAGEHYSTSELLRRGYTAALVLVGAECRKPILRLNFESTLSATSAGTPNSALDRNLVATPVGHHRNCPGNRNTSQ
jgi:hypothetical protein